jgi:hypothetical protein
MKTTINIIANSGDLSFNESRDIEAGTRVNIKEPIGSSASDLVIDATIVNDTADRLKFIAIQAQVADMTIKLADGSGAKVDASAEYSLDAGEVFIWPQTSGATAPAWVGEGTIEQILVTNDSDPAAAGTLVLSALYDPTA